MAQTVSNSSSMGRKELGNWGESIAARHLESLGLKIVERNWRCPEGEIDLVAQADSLLAFVEVKTRRSRGMGSPEEALTPRKSQKLLQLGALYVAAHDLDIDWRIDLVAVEIDHAGKLRRCEHIPDAVVGW